MLCSYFIFIYTSCAKKTGTVLHIGMKMLAINDADFAFNFDWLNNTCMALSKVKNAKQELKHDVHYTDITGLSSTTMI